MPLTALMLRRGDRQPGSVLAGAMARSRAAEVREAREAADSAADVDAHAAALIVRGYAPSAMTNLSLRLADIEGQIEAEKDKIAKGAQRAGYVSRDLAGGRLSPLEAARRMDLIDEGDPARAEKLERQAASIRRQIAGMAEAVTPPEARARHGVEQAISVARSVMEEVARLGREDDAAQAVARSRMVADRKAFYHSRGGSPFVSGADAAPEPGTEADCDCEFCAEWRSQEAAQTAEAQAGTLDGGNARAGVAEPRLSFRSGGPIVGLR